MNQFYVALIPVAFQIAWSFYNWKKQKESIKTNLTNLKEEMNAIKTKVSTLKLTDTLKSQAHELEEFYERSIKEPLEDDVKKCFNDAQQFHSKLNMFMRNTVDAQPSVYGELNEIYLNLELITAREIKELFDKFPSHLISSHQYRINKMCYTLNSPIHIFKRNDFNLLYRKLKMKEIYHLSKEEHCRIELRYEEVGSAITVQFQPTIPCAQLVRSYIEGEHEYCLYVVVKGQSGIQIKRGRTEIIEVKKDEECQIFEGDEIKLLENISYRVQDFFVKQFNKQ